MPLVASSAKASVGAGPLKAMPRTAGRARARLRTDKERFILVTLQRRRREIGDQEGERPHKKGLEELADQQTSPQLRCTSGPICLSRDYRIHGVLS
jgi:hypothetical protein